MKTGKIGPPPPPPRSSRRRWRPGRVMMCFQSRFSRNSTPGAGYMLKEHGAAKSRRTGEGSDNPEEDEEEL